MNDNIADPAPQSCHLVDAAGVRLAVEEWGNPAGEELLLIHGWMFSRQIFDSLRNGPVAERFRVVAFDLRGHGDSDRPASAAAYADAAAWSQDVAAVIAAKGLRRPIIVGWSLGSRVAIQYVATHGLDHVGGLNLVATVVAGHVAPRSEEQMRQVAAMLGDDLPARHAATRLFVEQCFRPEVDAAWIDAWTAAAMTVPVVARAGAMAWHRDYADLFGTIDRPVLVTHAAQDRLVPEESSRRLVGLIPGAELGVIEHSGHAVFVEQPDAYAAQLLAFADRVRSF